MKKLICSVLFLVTVFAGNAQSQTPQHEIKWNIINTIILGSVEIGYEYFIDGYQSVGMEFLINDVYNFAIGRQIKDFNTNSIKASYNYHISDDENGSGIVISPMLKYRFGDYQKTEESPVISMNSFILGIGGGYKWNLNDKFVFGPYINIARNFNKEVNDEFNTPIEFNAGFGIGYRF